MAWAAANRREDAPCSCHCCRQQRTSISAPDHRKGKGIASDSHEVYHDAAHTTPAATPDRRDPCCHHHFGHQRSTRGEEASAPDCCRARKEIAPDSPAGCPPPQVPAHGRRWERLYEPVVEVWTCSCFNRAPRKKSPVPQETVTEDQQVRALEEIARYPYLKLRLEIWRRGQQGKQENIRWLEESLSKANSATYQFIGFYVVFHGTLLTAAMITNLKCKFIWMFVGLTAVPTVVLLFAVLRSISKKSKIERQIDVEADGFTAYSAAVEGVLAHGRGYRHTNIRPEAVVLKGKGGPKSFNMLLAACTIVLFSSCIVVACSMALCFQKRCNSSTDDCSN